MFNKASITIIHILNIYIIFYKSFNNSDDLIDFKQLFPLRKFLFQYCKRIIKNIVNHRI